MSVTTQLTKNTYSQASLTLTMFVGVVALRWDVNNGVPQLPQTQSELFDYQNTRFFQKSPNSFSINTCF